MKKLLIVLVAILGFSWGYFNNIQVKADAVCCICHNINNPHEVCSDCNSYKEGHQNHLESGFDTDGRCPLPTSTPTTRPTEVPTSTIQPTNTPVQEPTVTSVPEPTSTIEPTEAPEPTMATVTPTSKPTETPGKPEDTTDHNKAGTWDAPKCTVPLPIMYNVDPTYKRVGNSVTIRWNHDGTDIKKWSINYGTMQHYMPYGIAYLPKEAREITINEITWGGHTWVALCGYSDDQGTCQNCIVFDP